MSTRPTKYAYLNVQGNFVYEEYVGGHYIGMIVACTSPNTLCFLKYEPKVANEDPWTVIPEDSLELNLLKTYLLLEGISCA